jgi:hypothetical protein
MKEQVRRCALLVLAMAPFTAISFAAKSSLSIAQLNKTGTTDAERASSLMGSKI